MKNTKVVRVVGIVEKVQLEGLKGDILAKIDTGADRSSIWASSIDVSKDGVLNFVLFDKESSHYTGQILRRDDFGVSKIKNSMGHSELRYRTKLSIKIGDRKIAVMFSLANRSKNRYKVLVGRRTLAGRFLVDVAGGVELPPRPLRNHKRNRELEEDAHLFHQRYFNKDAK